MTLQKDYKGVQYTSESQTIVQCTQTKKKVKSHVQLKSYPRPSNMFGCKGKSTHPLDLINLFLVSVRLSNDCWFLVYAKVK